MRRCSIRSLRVQTRKVLSCFWKSQTHSSIEGLWLRVNLQQALYHFQIESQRNPGIIAQLCKQYSNPSFLLSHLIVVWTLCIVGGETAKKRTFCCSCRSSGSTIIVHSCSIFRLTLARYSFNSTGMSLLMFNSIVSKVLFSASIRIDLALVSVKLHVGLQEWKKHSKHHSTPNTN